MSLKCGGLLFDRFYVFVVDISTGAEFFNLDSILSAR